MKKYTLMLAALALLTGKPVFADMKKHGEYCEKHCSVVQLRKEVNALKAKIQNGTAGDKAVTIAAEKAHLDKHIKELQDKEKELQGLESDLDK